MSKRVIGKRNDISVVAVVELILAAISFQRVTVVVIRLMCLIVEYRNVVLRQHVHGVVYFRHRPPLTRTLGVKLFLLHFCDELTIDVVIDEEIEVDER